MGVLLLSSRSDKLSFQTCGMLRRGRNRPMYMVLA
jgi:hypothetical protein